MVRGVAVAVLLQLAVCSLAVSIQYSPDSNGGDAAGSDDEVTDLGDLEEIDTAVANSTDASTPASFADYIADEAPAQLSAQGANVSAAADAAVAQEADVSRFTVEIKMPTAKSASKEPQAKLMGWKLGTEEGKPIQLVKIRGKGMLANHNSGNVEKPIIAGDELVEVNGVKWNGDTRAFEAALGKEIQATMRAPLRLLRLTVQRRKLAEQAAKAQEQETEQMIEATAQRSNIQRVEVEEKATISADIQEKTQIGEEKANGSTDVQATGSNLLEERPTLTAEAQAELSISKVEGLIAAWNKLHPEDPIELDQEKFRKAMSVSLVSRDVV
mmetsp:Transcript_40652/g.109047  ORF Transcript_40652/g.109047 Transcript_40652/m.109047 type:complete len:328 (-) Transcript_40652:165-1148(-)